MRPARRLHLEHHKLLPERRRYATPLLLVHGAWHGAWCWEAAARDFAERGFEVHTFSLRGHGESDRPRAFDLCSLEDYGRDLLTCARAIVPRPAVVGHSMGGFLLQLLLEEHQLPAAVLLCSIPHRGALPFYLRYLRRHPAAMLRALLTLDLREIVGTPELAREAFFREDIPRDLLERYTSKLGSESMLAALELGLLKRPDPSRCSSRVLVVAAEKDQIFTLDEERELARAYGAELLVVPDAAHDLMLDPSWPAAADAIERFVGRGLPPERAP